MTHSEPHVKFIQGHGYRFTNCEKYMTGLELANVLEQGQRLLKADSRVRSVVELPWLVVCGCLRINDVPLCYLDGSSTSFALSMASGLLTGGLSNDVLNDLPLGLTDIHYELLIEKKLEAIA